MRATAIWRRPKAWLTAVVGALLAVICTSTYLGASIDPQGRLHDLPVGVVNADTGAAAGGERVELGRLALDGVLQQGATQHRIAWQDLGSQEQALDRLADDRVYAVLVIPPDFSRSALGLLTAEGAGASAAPGERPALTVLTNPGAGGVAASLSQTAATAAAAEASARLGRQLLDRATGTPGPALRLLLADPVRVTTAPGHPVPAKSGGGTLPLYYAIMLLLAGLLPAIMVTTGLDVALGYLPMELGPKRVLQPAAPISRTQTLLAKLGIGAGAALLSGTAVLATATGLLGLETPHLFQLWLLSVGTTVTVATLTLCLVAALGTPGQLLALLLVTLFGAPTSGGAMPVQAMPSTLAEFGALLPARHVVDGVRSVLFFDARGAAGLGSAWLTLGCYLLLALAVGFGASRSYDRRGHVRGHRLDRGRAPVPQAGRPQAG
ncbi:ABC transporter permease [Kitasatospora sp. NPDC093806]|uniref:ABC transporter permease n=1 Tax=Kitasatospora sp. NPDC093806 TaxID=3155075 RepID=UPI0034274EB5